MFKFQSNSNKKTKSTNTFWLLMILSILAFAKINAATFYSQGTGSFSSLSNWNSLASGGGSNPIAADLTSGTQNFIVKDGHTVTIDQNITINQLTVGQGATGGLYVGDATSRTVTLNGALIVNAGASVLTGISTVTHNITFKAAITNNGTIDLFSDYTMFTNSTFNSVSAIAVGGSGLYNFMGVALTGTTTINLTSSVYILGAVSIATGCTINDGNLTQYVAGDWTETGTGQRTGNGTIEFIGGNFTTIPVQSITLNSAVTFNNWKINGSSETVILNGPVITNGNFTVDGNSSVLCTNGSNHSIAGNFTVVIGSSYSQTAGTLTFNGSTTQNINVSFSSFNAITFSNGGIGNPKNITGDLLATGIVTINVGAAVEGSGNHAFNGGMRQDGTCGFTGSITFGGGTVNSSLAATDFGTASIVCGNNANTVFAQAVAANPVTFNINNDFTILAGSGAVFGACANTGVVTFNGQIAYNFNANGNIWVRGANGFPINFGSYTFGGASTTTYDCNFAQVVRGNVSYNNLTLTSTTFANAKTLDGPLDVNGNLTINTNVNANFIGYDISIAGNHTVANGGAFINDGTVSYDAVDGAQVIGTVGSTGTYTYENISLTLDNPTNNRTKTINTNMIVNGNFIENNNNGSSTTQLIVNLQDYSITNDFSGQFILGDYTLIYVSGLNTFKPSMNSFGQKSLSTLSTVRYNNATQNSVQVIADGFTYGNLEIQGSGAGINYKSAAGSLDINGNFLSVAANPVFRDSSFSHSIGGNYNLRDVNYVPSGCGVTITFDGDFQTIGAGYSNMKFSNVVFEGTGTKTFTSQANYIMDVSCDLTIGNNVTVDANNKNININGNFNNNGTGTFTQTTGYLVRFQSTIQNQTVSSNSNSYFGGITINKPSVGFKTLVAATDLDIRGTLLFTTNAADFDATGRTVNISANLTCNTGTTFTSTGSTFNFNGTVAQTLQLTPNPVTFNCVNFTGSGTKTQNAGAMIVNCDVNIDAASIFNAAANNITIFGNWINNGTFQQTCTNSVTFSANGPQSISASSFATLILGGNGTKTLGGSINTCGALTINSGVTLETTTNNYALSVGGNWTNNGTFNVNSSLVTFTGNAKNLTTGGNLVGKQFYNLNIAQTAGQSATLLGNVAVLNDFTITSGNFVTGAFTVDAYGNWIVSDVFNSSTNTGLVTLRASSGSKIFSPGSTSTCTYRGLTVNGGATYTLTNTNLILSNAQPFTLTNGTFKLGGKTVQLTANATIAAGATLDVDAGAILQLSNATTLTNNGGNLKVVGTASNYATIQRNASGNFSITQNNGTLQAKYYSIQNTNAAGLTVSGGTIDATNNLSAGIFSNGVGTSYINLNGLSFSDFTVNNVQFLAGPTYNVARTSGTGNVTFAGASGTLAGSAYENDDLGASTGRVRWTTSAKKWTNGVGNNDWNTAGNWSPAVIPQSGDTVYIDHNTIAAATAITVNITNVDVNIGRLVLDRNSFSGTGNITLNIQSNRTLTVSENINILVGTTLAQANSTAIVRCGGSFLNSGTYTHGNSTLFLDAASTNSYSLSAGASSFYNLTCAATNQGTYQLAGNATVANDLNVLGGTMDVTTSNYSITVTGNWTNSFTGLFLPQLGTVTFNKTGAQTINGGPFYDLITAGTGTKSMTSNITVQNDLTIGASTVLDGSTYILFVARNWTNNAVGGFTQSGVGTIQFNGIGNQAIDNGSQTSTFNNVIVMLAGGIKTISRPFTINGDFTITSGSGTVDFGTQQVTGTGSKIFSLAGSATAIIRGSSNFPSGFGTVALATNSTVQYTSDLSQSIFATTYGNLTLARATAVNSTKALLGDILVAGNLTINDVNIQLNAVNRNLTLTGNLAFPAGGRAILWGTTGTFIHNGNGWNIDVDYKGFSPDFNNLTLTGSVVNTKTMLANLNIGGNVLVQNGVSLTMGSFTMTGSATKSLTLETGSRVNSAIPSSTGVAFPTGFSNYLIDCASLVVLNGGVSNQTISSSPTYGNLTLSNTGSATLNGNLNICGDLNTNTATFVDAGFNINSTGSNVELRLYSPSSTTTLTLNGGDQTVVNSSGNSNLVLPNIVCANAGTKIFNVGYYYAINFNHNVLINSGTSLSITNRNVRFSGTTWTNNGIFGHYNVNDGGFYFYYDGTLNQTVDMGANNTYQQYVYFVKPSGSVTFINNGGNFTRTSSSPLAFYINPTSTVNMGTLTHDFKGTIQNLGTWNTTDANFNFSGTNQSLITPTFIANNINCNGNGTITMGCNWSINDLTIGQTATLNTTALNNYSITLTGNWINNGVFTVNSADVYFESSNSTAKVIQVNNSQFRNVFFNQTQFNARTYTLTSANNTFNRELTIGNGATLNLNGKVLTLGANNGYVETHSVAVGGTLYLNDAATLYINSDNGNSNVNILGTLVTVGTTPSPARITRATNNNRINITISGTISAQYYAYEYFSDNGMVLNSSALVDATNNFSNGVWSFINTVTGAPRYYLQLNNTAGITNPITGVTFNFGGTPTVGTHFNVLRTITPTVTFSNPLSGALGSFLYESDAVMPASATTGFVRWPVPNQITWTGATSRDWNLASNWSPAQIPTLADDAIIPDVVNDPLIKSADAVCKNLTITDGNLGLSLGFDLTVYNNVLLGSGTSAAFIIINNDNSDITVYGSWTKATNSLFVNGGKNASVNFVGASGSFTISPGFSSFYNLNINAPNSTYFLTGNPITVDNDLQILDGTLYPNTINYTLNVKGDWVNNGIFSIATPGTVNFSGTIAQTITNGSFYNLTLSGSNIKSTFGTLSVANTAQVQLGSNLTATSGSNWNLQGNVNFLGSYNDGGETHSFSGSTWTGTGTCTLNTGTILFNRQGAQTCATAAFNSLDFTGGGTKTLSGDVTVNGDVYVRNSINYLNLNTSAITSNTGTGVFTVETGATLYIRGANNSPANFGGYDFDATSTTYYDANINQTIGGVSYGNLSLNSPNVKTLGENTSVKGNLTINTSTLDVSTNNYTLFVSGDFNNNSTGSFICNAGEVIMDGTAAANQNVWIGTTGVKTFYDFTVNKPNGLTAVLGNNNPVILNDLRVQSGILNINGNNVTVGGDLQASTGLFATSGTFTLNNSSGLTSNIQTNASTLNNIVVNGPSTTFKLLDNMTINGNFTLTAGTFDNNSYTANLGNGNRTITIDGTYKVSANGKLGLGNGATLTVSSGGVIEVVGNSTQIATVSNNLSGGRYNFIVNGTIKAQNYLFEYMSTSGIQIGTSSTINTTDNFSNGTFTNGAANGIYLQVENTQTLLIENTNFGYNPGGTAKNVVKTTSTSGVLTFNNSFGIFAGTSFENDPHNLINWTGPIVLTWNGNVSTNWFTASNWTASSGPSIVPTGAEDVIIATSSNQPVVSLDGAITNKLTINSGATLTLNTPYASTADFTVNGDIIINGVLFSQGAGDSIIVYGNWTKSTLGTFIQGNSTVIYASNQSGTTTINNGTSLFNNVEVKGTSYFQLGANTTANGYFSILTGSLDVTSSNFSITAKKNWLNQATFNPRGGTVYLTAATGTISINNGAANFNNLSINPTAGVVYNAVTNDIRCNGNMDILSGTLNLNNLSIYNGDNVGSDVLSISGTLDLGTSGSIRNGSASTINVNNGGVLKMIGASSSVLAKVTRQSGATNYAFNINSGGTIHAQYYLVEYTNGNGLNIKNGANINATNNLSNGTFSNGFSGGSSLTMNNTFADFTISNVTFNNGATYNVSRISGSGVVTFLDAAGTLGNYLYENDDLNASTGNIRWVYTQTIYTWTGAVDNDWFNPNNWLNSLNSVPPAAPDATITANIPNVTSGSNRFPVVATGSSYVSNGTNATCFDLSIFVGGLITFSNSKNINVTNSVTNSGTITISNGSVTNITVANLWSNLGIFNNGGASTVTLTSVSGIKSLTPGASSFYNLTLNTGSTFQTLGNVDMDGSLTITAGTLQVNNSAHQLFVGGNWTNNGTFINGSGLVTFDKTSGTQTITNPAGETFYNLKIANAGTVLKTVVLTGTLNVNGNLDIFNVKCELNAGSNTINVKGNWTNNGNSFISTGTVNFIGTTNQTIKRVAAAGENFNNLTLTNASDAKLLSNATLAGNLVINTGAFDASTRVLTIQGNLTGAGNLSVTSGSIFLSGAYSNNGTFTKGTSTFTYQGSGSQTIRAVDYNNLTSASTGARVLASTGTIGISGAFTIGANVYTNTGSTVNFNGTVSQVIPVFSFNNLTSSSTGSRTLASGTINLAGNFTPGSNVYSSAGNTMNFNGSGVQNVAGAFIYFRNLTKSNGGTLNLGGNITIAANLVISAGTVNTNQYQITGNAVALFTMAAGTTITIGSTTNATAVTWPTNYTGANTTLNCASTQIYQSNSATQTIANVSPATYGILQIASGATASTKNLATGTVSVCGNFTSSANTTLNVGSSTFTLTGNYLGTGNLSFTSGTFNIAGDWTNLGSVTLGTSTINYNGSSSQTIGAANYYNLTSSNSGARTLASSGTIGVANVFTPGTNSYIITGSTVDFNGTVSQTIPAFDFNNLSSSNTGTRTLTAGNIGVTGNFTMGIGNTYSYLGSTVVFNGTGTQTSSAFTFDNITINKVSGSVTPLGAINIEGTMTLSNGNYNTNGQNVTFVSSVSRTGRIAPITSGTITGDIIMQRAAPAGSTGWTWLGSCITNTTLADWYNAGTEIWMSGFTGVSYAGTFTSVYTYDETASGDQNAALSYVAPTNATNSIELGKGYWVYLGSGQTTTTDILFDARGTVHTGNFTFPVTYTNNGLPNADGWNLVANPYPSAIDWDNGAWTKTNISNTYYTWNIDINNYVTYTTGVGGTNGGTKDIPSSQGFYIKASGSPTLSATENVKSNGQPIFVKSASNLNLNNGNVSIKVTKAGSLLTDEAIFRIDNVNAIDGLDDLDAYKMYPLSGPAINVSTNIGNDDFTINSLQNFDHSFNIPVKFVTNNAGVFTITIDGVTNLINNYPAEFTNDYLVLVDETGNETNLNSNNSFTFTISDNSATKNFNIRFHNYFVTKLPEVSKLTNKGINAGFVDGVVFLNFKDNGQDEKSNVTIYNSLGKIVTQEKVLNSRGLHYINSTKNISSGIYLINIESIGSSERTSLKIKVD